MRCHSALSQVSPAPLSTLPPTKWRDVCLFATLHPVFHNVIKTHRNAGIVRLQDRTARLSGCRRVDTLTWQPRPSLYLYENTCAYGLYISLGPKIESATIQWIRCKGLGICLHFTQQHKVQRKLPQRSWSSPFQRCLRLVVTEMLLARSDYTFDCLLMSSTNPSMSSYYPKTNEVVCWNCTCSFAKCNSASAFLLLYRVDGSWAFSVPFKRACTILRTATAIEASTLRYPVCCCLRVTFNTVSTTIVTTRSKQLRFCRN